MKRVFGVLISTIILFSTTVIFAQTNALQITNGRFLIDGRTLNGTGNFQTSAFSATVNFTDSVYSPWTACYGDGCNFGSTFTVPNGYAFANSYRGNSFTTGGVTYNNAHHTADGLALVRETFFIPKVSKRKGLLTIRKPFTLAGRFRVCEINDANQPCPVDKILFDGNIEGHGTLIITGRIKTDSYGRPRWYIESFEHIFES